MSTYLQEFIHLQLFTVMTSTSKKISQLFKFRSYSISSLGQSLVLISAKLYPATTLSSVRQLQMTNRQGSFPAGTPGNGVPEVILTVGSAFKPALGELYKKHPVCTKIRLFEIQNQNKILGRGTDPGAHTVWFPQFFF